MKNKKFTLTKINAREILDSRGWPTIEAEIFCGQISATVSLPSGASTGSHEALELRDGDKNRFLGKGVLKAIKNIEGPIFKAIKNINLLDQDLLDYSLAELDGTENKTKLGANAILAISLGCAKLAAKLSSLSLYSYIAKINANKQKLFLPTPLLNVINGGLHADSGLDVQEFFIIPKGRLSFSKKIERAKIVIEQIKKLLEKLKLATSVGDEGGFAPKLGSNEKALRLLAQAIEEAGFNLGKDFGLGLDAAASEFFDKEKEIYRFAADGKNYKPTSIYNLYKSWVQKFGVEIIEDGCSEDDFSGWQSLTLNLGKHSILVGDDLFVTNPHRLQVGIISGIANAVLIKPNQIGTLTETLQTVNLAKKHGYKIVISHRSGETMDDFIADLAVGVGADYIKAGSLARGERLAKYNRLIKIEAELSK